MNPNSVSIKSRHRRWVKLTHWIITISFLVLVVSGYFILMVHPRLYWGEAGNDLTPALIELPISRNYQHGGWEKTQPFFEGIGSPVSSSRTYDIFNQNGWGRSLHFLAGWFLVATGVIYFFMGVFTRHFQNRLWPGVSNVKMRLFWKDFVEHLKRQVPTAANRAQYGLLQKTTYLIVVFFLMPTVILTGLTMSPAVTAAFPFLIKIFFGAQSARTIHFFASVALVLFLIIHVVMIARTGFKQQIKSMTFGQ